MPTLRPFRALRFADARDLSDRICPPYDVIAPSERARLVARHPHNMVQLELPEAAAGDPDGDEPYRRASRTLVEWRNARVLRKDERPSVYVYEATYSLPGAGGGARTDVPDRSVRGFFARVRIEPPGQAILPHERTLSAPKEDRFRLLKATGVNLSPVMALYRSQGGTAEAIGAVTAGEPISDALDDVGTRHRLWAAPADGDQAEAVHHLLAAAGNGPITIADGHHRYETALRYATERGQHRACESDPPYDYVLMLLFDTATEPLTVLPTHRVLADGPRGEDLLSAAASLFAVEPVSDAAGLVAAFATGSRTDDPRLGVWSAGRAAILRPLQATLEAVAASGAVSALGRPLDVAILAWALDRLAGIGAAATAGGSIRYTRDASEALALVDGGASSAFLLDATPVDAVLEVAAAGGVMPQKSTYFHPKVATGLLLNPLES